MDYLEGGRDLKSIEPGELPPEALDQLRNLISAIHARGVIHFDIGHDSNGDYGRETNLLWKNGQLYIIDIRKFFPQEPIDSKDLPTPRQASWLRRLKKL